MTHLYNIKEALKPCVYFAEIGEKATNIVDFNHVLQPAIRSNCSDVCQSLLECLTQSREKLLLQTDKSGERRLVWSAGLVSSDYINHIVEYLSLLKGFSCDRSALPQPNGPSSNPMQAQSSTKDDNTMRQSLLQADGATQTVEGDPSQVLEKLICICDWDDILQCQRRYTADSHQEYALVLFGAGVFLRHHALTLADQVAMSREGNEQQLRESYTALLQASGVFEACLQSIGVKVEKSGAAYVDLSVKSTEENKVQNTPSDMEMQQWRKEQNQLQSSSQSQSIGGINHGVVDIRNIGDLVDGLFPQLLSWICLAQAQELTIYRACGAEESDPLLIAKLCMDTSTRYQDCRGIISKLEKKVNSSTIVKLMSYCSLKTAYYVSLVSYFQGMMHFKKDSSEGCAKAIAHFKQAQKMIEDCQPLLSSYTQLLHRPEHSRQQSLHNQMQRTKEIITRELDIANQRNNSVYYEPVSSCDPLVEGVTLVKPTPFPNVQVHPLWNSQIYDSFDPKKKIYPERVIGSSKCCCTIA